MLKGTPVKNTFRVEQVETGRYLDAHEGLGGAYDEEGGHTAQSDEFDVMTRELQKNKTQHWVFTELDHSHGGAGRRNDTEANQRAANAMALQGRGGRAGAGAAAGFVFGVCLRCFALCGIKCHDDDTTKGEWDCDEKVSVIYGPFFELYTYIYRFFAVWQIFRSVVLICLLEFLQDSPVVQIWSLVSLELASFFLVYVKKPHLDGTERIAALGGSLINLFFLLCPMFFVYRGYEAKDAAGLLISAQMLVIAMEIYVSVVCC